jgi:hypothetical protein
MPVYHIGETEYTVWVLKNTLKDSKMATALNLEVISCNFNIYVHGFFFWRGGNFSLLDNTQYGMRNNIRNLGGVNFYQNF